MKTWVTIGMLCFGGAIGALFSSDFGPALALLLICAFSFFKAVAANEK